MLKLPASDSSLLVRTDFTDDESWERASYEASVENEDGFRAYIHPVNDPALDGAAWQIVRTAALATNHGAAVLFIADHETLMSPDHPILVVDLVADRGAPLFRCIPSELWSVDNNLNIANMDWEEFASAAGADGVFRGFAT